MPTKPLHSSLAVKNALTSDLRFPIAIHRASADDQTNLNPKS